MIANDCPRDEFDVAYLLSPDGDFTPAVKVVSSLQKSRGGKDPLGFSFAHLSSRERRAQ